MIRREDVADLREGDVVEIAWPSGTIHRGKLVAQNDGLRIADSWTLRYGSGNVAAFSPQATLTVVSRAKPRCYVNSDKTEPDLGDVVRDADTDALQVWACVDKSGMPWITTTNGDHDWWDRDGLPDRLRLLVDGRTGQVVQ